MSALPPFLEPDVIARGCVEAGLGQRACAVLSALAQRIADSGVLREVSAEAHAAVFHDDGVFVEAVAAADLALGGDAELLHALFLLDTLRLVHERQRARGVDVGISRAINERHGVAWLRAARDAEGVPRVRDWAPSWFRLVASGELYRLGRLELTPQRWDHPFRVYEHERTGEVVALAESGLGFSASGELAAPGIIPAWCSELTETDDGVIGSAISPGATLAARRVHLPAEDWRLALVADDWVLDLHVPTEGELTIPALRDSLEQSLPFFARYYPARTFTAFVCYSWLFSTQLERLLQAPSNILAWQREGYLLPASGGHDDFLNFTFGARSLDLVHAPRDTRLRRAIVSELERGAQLHCGLYLLLTRDLHRFGNAPYRHAAERARSESMDGA
jgi:hypothetical protein